MQQKFIEKRRQPDFRNALPTIGRFKPGLANNYDQIARRHRLLNGDPNIKYEDAYGR
jgi:hypothetical protein